MQGGLFLKGDEKDGENLRDGMSVSGSVTRGVKDYS